MSVFNKSIKNLGWMKKYYHIPAFSPGQFSPMKKKFKHINIEIKIWTNILSLINYVGGRGILVEKYWDDVSKGVVEMLKFLINGSYYWQI